MDGLKGYYVKWNKSEKEKYCIISLIYGILKKNIYIYIYDCLGNKTKSRLGSR